MTDSPATPEGRAYCIVQMCNCPGKEALRRVWDTFSDAYKRDRVISGVKDMLKEDME